MAGGKAESVRVCARFRPRNEKEKAQTKDKLLRYEVDRGDTSVTFHGVGPNTTQTNRGAAGGKRDEISFTLDRIYGEESTQDEVFEWIANNIVKHCFEGYNGTIFAYGQTSSGKTHTMFGPDNYMETPDEWGIVPKSMSELFNFVHSSPAGWEFAISTSYFQLYKERIQDLLKPANNNLKIHESKARGIYVEGLSSEYLEDVQNLLDVLTVGGANKAVASTDMNARSSRSHSMLQVTLVQRNEEGSSKTGRFTFVDLAGSERADKTNAVGQTFDEAKKINLSLTCLANVIKSLSAGNPHIPYRDSKLTRILQDSLGGNTKTMLILCCSPDLSNIEETLSTLRFGKSAKNIKNQVKLNLRRSAQELEYMLKRLQEELNAERKQVETLRSEIDWMKSPDYNPENKPDVEEQEEEPKEVFEIEDRMMMEQELESKQVRIESLQEELSTLQTDHEESCQEIKNQKETLDQMQATLKKLEAAAKVDNRKIEQLGFDLESSKADKVVIENQVDAWKQKLDASNATRERLQQTADKLKADIGNFEEEKSELSNKILESEQEVINLQEQLNNAKEKTLMSTQASEKLEKDLKHIEEKLSKSEAKAKSLAEKHSELQTSHHTADEKIKSLEAELSSAKSDLSQKEEEMKKIKESHETLIAQAETEMKEKQDSIDTLESKLKESQKMCDDLSKDYKDQTFQLSQVENESNRMKKSLEETKTLLDTTVAEHEERQKELEENLNKERDTSSTLEAELLDLRKSLHRHRGTVDTTVIGASAEDGSVEQVEALFQTIDKYKNVTEEYKEKIKKAEEGATDLRTEITKLREEKKELLEKNEIQSDHHAKALVDLEDKMNAEIKEEKERALDLRTKLMEKRSVLMKLTTEKRNAEREHRTSVSEGKSLKAEVEKHVENIKALEGNERRLNMVIAKIHQEKEEQHEAHLEKMSKLELEKLQLADDLKQLDEQKKVVADQLSEKAQEITTLKMQVLKEKSVQDKWKQEVTKLTEEFESSQSTIVDMQTQIDDTLANSKREVDAHLANLETSRSMIQKQADHISSLESELRDRDEQIQEKEESEIKMQEQQQELHDEFDELKEKYDTLVAEMPMRVRAKIFKPVLGGREKALKEKIDLGGVRKQLRRVGRKSLYQQPQALSRKSIGGSSDDSQDKPPPPPPKDSE